VLTQIVNSYVNLGSPTNDPNALSYSGSGRNPVQEDAGMARVDYLMSGKTTAFVRFTTDEFASTSPNGIEVGFGGQLSSQYNGLIAPNAVLDVAHTFSPTIFTDARVGFNRDENHEGGD